MEEEFIDQLQEARMWAGIPFKINSGFRCEKHNREIGGEENSAHLRGYAADISATTSRQREKLLEALFKADFNRIGIAETFIHADNDPYLPLDVAWLYPQKTGK